VKCDSTEHGEDHKHTFCLPQLQTANSDTQWHRLTCLRKVIVTNQSSRAKLILPTIILLQCFPNQTQIPSMQYNAI